MNIFLTTRNFVYDKLRSGRWKSRRIIFIFFMSIIFLQSCNKLNLVLTDNSKPIKFKSIKKALKHSDKMIVLDLSNKNLDTLPCEITKLKNLVYLDLGCKKNKHSNPSHEVYGFNTQCNNLMIINCNLSGLTRLQTIRLSEDVYTNQLLIRLRNGCLTCRIIIN